jgi:hypothetical protein
VTGGMWADCDLIVAVKKAREYMSKPDFKDYVIEEYGPIAQLHSDEEIEAYVRTASSE